MNKAETSYVSHEPLSKTSADHVLLGWFVSTGDLSSGLFTLAIACHAFGGIVYEYRLGPKAFGAVIVGLWTFNYTLAIIGVSMHSDLYQRAGAWCWIQSDYTNERLYLHYFWLIFVQFFTVVIYALTWIILRRRVSTSFYSTDTLQRARTASKIILAYPVVYIVCTLPLVKARLTSMAGGSVSFLELTIAGAIITSNGWLDVLLYLFTRRALLFGAEFKSLKQEFMDMMHLRPDRGFGTTTIIEGPPKPERPRPTRMLSSLSGKGRRPSRPAVHSRSGSTDELFVGTNGVKSETTVIVHNEVMEMDALRRDGGGGRQQRGREY